MFVNLFLTGSAEAVLLVGPLISLSRRVLFESDRIEGEIQIYYVEAKLKGLRQTLPKATPNKFVYNISCCPFLFK